MRPQSGGAYSPHYEQLRVAVLSAGPSSGVVGGAERFYQGLLDGLIDIGCRAELIALPADEGSFEEIKTIIIVIYLLN